MADILRQRTTAEWLAEFNRHGIPAMPVKSLNDVLADPHLAEVGVFPLFDHPSEGQLRCIGIPVRFSETPGAFRRPPPRLGEHSIEVLHEAGLRSDEIQALLELGVIVDATAGAGNKTAKRA